MNAGSTSASTKPDPCSDGKDHCWVLRSLGRSGHEEVHCARCMRCLGAEAMLRAYVTLHGGEFRRG